MQIIITDLSGHKMRLLDLSLARIVVLGFLAISMIAGLAVLGYHSLFVSGAAQNWPVLGRLLNAGPAAHAQNSRYVRENLDVLATKVGEMRVKMGTLDELAKRVSTQTGVKPETVPTPPGMGGALVGSSPLSMGELDALLAALDQSSDERLNYFAQIESRLFDEKVRKMMVPTQRPLANAPLGSAFGWRRDPFTGRSAMHTGLDFAGAAGTPILAAAGGIVVTQELNTDYGNMVEIDHGNQLITRYAHASKVMVKKGDLVTRGQVIAAVGSTGRSTGPHLHFEVFLQGQRQDPWPFLQAGSNLASAAPQAVPAVTTTALVKTPLAHTSAALALHQP